MWFRRNLPQGQPVRADALGLGVLLLVTEGCGEEARRVEQDWF